jgi:hypothetical protein
MTKTLMEEMDERRAWKEAVADQCLHTWQPVSFVFETQLLDNEGRVKIRQPDTYLAKVFCVCMACRAHTWVETRWIGYYLGGPEELYVEVPEHDDGEESTHEGVDL